MKYINIVTSWIKNNFVPILLVLFFGLYVYANGKSISIDYQEKVTADKESFVCQTSCFPQQHEYIYAGNVGSCWCYTDETTLKKIGK